jgi:hypothetical protein
MTRMNPRKTHIKDLATKVTGKIQKAVVLIGNSRHKKAIIVPSWMDIKPYNTQYIQIMKEINSRKR